MMIANSTATSSSSTTAIPLRYMFADLKSSMITSNLLPSLPGATGAIEASHPLSAAASPAQFQILDLEHNILQAKGLRTALCVRIVHTREHLDTVVYVLRVEDVETGLQWVVHRRYVRVVVSIDVRPSIRLPVCLSFVCVCVCVCVCEGRHTWLVVTVGGAFGDGGDGGSGGGNHM